MDRTVAACRPPQPFGDRAWIIVLSLLPCVYLGTFILPPPLGLGVHIANDFPEHRIWWTQMDAYFIARGYFPLWNPLYEMGAPYLSNAFGTGTLYPLRWLSLPPTALGGRASYLAQYAQVAAHIALALVGVFVLLRRHAQVSGPAAALAAATILVNQSFNNVIRFPHAIENFAWVPWILHFALNLARPPNGAALRPAVRREWLRDGLALSLCIALCWLTGYGQYAYVGGLVVGIIILIAARSLRGLIIALLAAILGTALAAGDVWPAAEWVLHHPLRRGADVAGIHTVGMTDYADMLLGPFSVDVHYSFFTLPALVMFGMCGLAFAWRAGRARLSLAMLLMLILLTDNSRGVDGVSFRFLFDHLPFYGAFNSPSKNMWLAFVPLAWFVAHGLEWALHHRRAAMGASAALLAAGAALAIAYVPDAPHARVGIWRPLVCGWITPEQSVFAYAWLVLAPPAAISLFLLVRKRWVQAAVLLGVCWTFAAFYAQYNTFVSPELNPKALIATRDAYPDGLLARRHRAGYLGVTGLGWTSPNVDPDIYDFMMRTDHGWLGDEHTRFPASRFRWTPAAGDAGLIIRLIGYGPNHIELEATATGSGRLVYLCKHSHHWRSNHPARRDASFGEFIEWNVAPGATVYRLEFCPVSHLVAALTSMVGVFGLAGGLLAACRRRGSAIALVVVGLVLGCACAAGALTRRSMSAEDLFGRSGISLDPQGIVPPSPR